MVGEEDREGWIDPVRADEEQVGAKYYESDSAAKAWVFRGLMNPAGNN
jgi:hypothetical protein